MKINIGCGQRNFGKEWIHIDGADYDHIDSKDILMKEYENESAELIYASHLIEYFDNIVIGGAMANTFLLAKGFNVGKSLVEKELIKPSKEILEKAKNNNCNIIFPTDVVCSNNLKDSINIRYSDINDILPDQMILDIGNKTIQIIIKTLLRSNMILWNGPLGAFEHKPFDYATIKIANTIRKNV